MLSRFPPVRFAERPILCLLGGVLLGLLAAPQDSSANDPVTPSLSWLGNCRLVRSSLAEARQHLEQSDTFTRAMSPFDRMSRLGRGEDPGEAALRSFAAAQAEAWRDEDWRRLTEVAQSLRQRLATLPPLPWPREIRLITTTGAEEGDAAYCRGAAVILPRSVLGRPADSLERLLAHELFHVLSNQNPAWRQRLYAVVGFVPCPEIRLPDALRDRKITNPDGPLVDCRITLTVEDKSTTVAPVLLANVDRYDPAAGGSFFRYLTFQLLVVEAVDEERWRPSLRDGMPFLLDPKTTPAYLDRIGKNTRYIIHPDEILADNFVHLVFRTPDLSSPRILEDLRAALEK